MHSAHFDFAQCKQRGFTVRRTGSLGFTLIELLVVIAIISIMSVLAYVNFKDFSADQALNKAVGQIQTYLRLAQSNATSSTLCNTQSATSWSLKFTSTSTIELHCSNPADILSKSYTLEGVQMQIKCGADVLALPTTFTYSTGVGTLTTACSGTVTFTITNTSNPGAAGKSFNISKGGAIDVQ